jgi:4-diphosphocytidyl-2-C-methyl-D-erythritol kinase
MVVGSPLWSAGNSADLPDTLIESAPAKVNLFLHVTGWRPDGYHLLDSLVVFAAAEDVLRGEPANELTLDLEGPFAISLGGEQDNLVLRAARALGARGARLVLEKNLPVASGIGGGSADAAAALRLLCRLWRLSPPDLPGIALALGADVPVCLARRASRMGGVGEQLDAAPSLPGCGLVLVNPGVAVSTPEVFRARRGGWSAPAEMPRAWPDVATMARDLRELRNDLEPPAIALQPVIGDVISALVAVPGCRLARMSGSGATCFGLFDDPVVAAQAAARLRRANWWTWGGPLAES